jgi:hypothetical protein
VRDYGPFKFSLGESKKDSAVDPRLFDKVGDVLGDPLWKLERLAGPDTESGGEIDTKLGGSPCLGVGW